MQVCYLRSPDECIYTFSQLNLLASLPNDPSDPWPPISLQLNCDQNFDISGFNINPIDIVNVPGNGSLVVPSTLLAASASFDLGWPGVVGDIAACICISDTCTNQGEIFVRGVYELFDPVDCEPNTPAACSIELQSPSVAMNGLDPISIVPLVLNASSAACSSTLPIYSSVLPVSTSTSVINGALILTRNYSIINVSGRLPAGDYMICYCAWESNCQLYFPMYVGIFRVASIIMTVSVLPSTTVRVTNQQFSLLVEAASSSTGYLTCAVGTNASVQPGATMITGCDFMGCEFVTTTGLTNMGDNFVHFFFTNSFSEGVANIWCFDSSFPSCVYPPSGWSPVLVTIPPAPSSIPLVDLIAYRSSPIVFPAVVSSMGEYKLWSNSSSCYEPSDAGLTGLVGMQCTSNTSSCTKQTVVSNALQNLSLCYCDQVVADNCLSWSFWGTVAIVGPNMTSLQYVSPGNLTSTFDVLGVGLATTDLVAVLEGITCELSSSQWGTVSVTNSTYESFSYMFPTMGTFTACWCPSVAANVCTIDPLVVRTIVVAVEMDCVMSVWTVVTSCSVPCGGGTLEESREIVSGPQGGGAACPTDMTREVTCNSQPCPPALLSSISPTTVHAGQSFGVVVIGENLRPGDDAVAVDSIPRACSGSISQVMCGNWTFANPGTLPAMYCSRSAAPNCVDPASFNLGGWKLLVQSNNATTTASNTWSSVEMWVSITFGCVLVLIAVVVSYCRRRAALESSEVHAETMALQDEQLSVLDDGLSAPSTPNFPLELLDSSR